MTPQYSVERGLTSMFVDLRKAGIPALQNYVYDTHAPYDALAESRTLLLGKIAPTYKLYACSSVDYTPNESFMLTSLLDVPAEVISIGDVLGGPFRATRAVGSLVIHATRDETNITFFGRGANASRVVQICGLTAESACVGARSLLFATLAKLTKR